MSQSTAELSAHLCNEVSKVALIEMGAQEMTASANHTPPTLLQFTLEENW